MSPSAGRAERRPAGWLWLSTRTGVQALSALVRRCGLATPGGAA